MTDYLGTPDYVHGTRSRLGVLLVNLGTPDEPTTPAVRRYLAEFLWDPRVIEMPRVFAGRPHPARREKEVRDQ